MFQVGANVGETITVGLSTSMLTTQIGKTADYVNGRHCSTAARRRRRSRARAWALHGLASNVTIAVGTGQAVNVGVVASQALGAGQAARRQRLRESARRSTRRATSADLTATADTTLAFDFCDCHDGRLCADDQRHRGASRDDGTRRRHADRDATSTRTPRRRASSATFARGAHDVDRCRWT